MRGVDVPKAPEEEGAEAGEGLRALCERRPLDPECPELLEEVRDMHAKYAGRHIGRSRVVVRPTVSFDNTSIERRRVRPDIAPLAVVDPLDSDQRAIVRASGAEEKAIRHMFAMRIAVV